MIRSLNQYNDAKSKKIYVLTLIELVKFMLHSILIYKQVLNITFNALIRMLQV